MKAISLDVGVAVLVQRVVFMVLLEFNVQVMNPLWIGLVCNMAPNNIMCAAQIYSSPLSA